MFEFLQTWAAYLKGMLIKAHNIDKTGTSHLNFSLNILDIAFTNNSIQL